MQQPSIITTFKDEAKGITYELVAYRKLTQEEAILMIRHAYASKNFKKPKRGQKIRIATIIGHNEQ